MRRILVIDDEAQIRRLLEIALSNLDWEVFSAPTGLEGLETARGAKPDLILLDLNLPDMSGADLLSRLREWSTIPVIVISVRDAERDIIALLNAGADDYVVKPFYTNELVARIEAVHRRRMPEREPVFKSGRLEVDAERARGPRSRRSHPPDADRIRRPGHTRPLRRQDRHARAAAQGSLGPRGRAEKRVPCASTSTPCAARSRRTLPRPCSSSPRPGSATGWRPCRSRTSAPPGESARSRPINLDRLAKASENSPR